MGNKSTSDIDSVLVYKSLSRYLKFSENEEGWWHKTAPLLNKILAAAKYDVHLQYRYLVFYYAACVSALGPYPQRFSSSITRSGLPVEFSVNYQNNSKPIVRIGYEPISHLSGTERDPYNHKTASEIVATLSKIQPDFDPRLFNYFVHQLSVNKAESDVLNGANVEGSEMKSQTAFGFDLVNGEISVKGYAFPAMKCQVSQQSLSQLLKAAINGLKGEFDCAFGLVDEYMERCGGYNQFSFVSWDCVVPAKSRFKVYGVHNDVTWKKIEDIWTLGGQATSGNVTKGLELLKELWTLIDLDEGERGYTGRFDDANDNGSNIQSPMVWNYELRPNNPWPLAKFYFPVHGENDMKIVKGLARFFENRGWTELARSYVQTVSSFL